MPHRTRTLICFGVCAAAAATSASLPPSSTSLHPVGPQVLAGILFYREVQIPKVLRFLRQFGPAAPRELFVGATLRVAPPAPFLPEEVHGTKVIGVGAFCAGTVEAGERALEPLRTFLEPIADVASADSAYTHRQAPVILNINTRWDDGDAERHIDWTRALWAATRPFSAGGVYVKFLGQEGAERVLEAYGPEKFERLVALKRKFDPTNFFRINQNIPPA